MRSLFKSLIASAAALATDPSAGAPGYPSRFSGNWTPGGAPGMANRGKARWKRLRRVRG